MAIWRGTKKCSRWSGPSSTRGFLQKRTPERERERIDSPIRTSRTCYMSSSTPPVWRTADGGPSIADEDWHAVCQALYMGVEQAEWANQYYKFVDRNQKATSAVQLGVTERRCHVK